MGSGIRYALFDGDAPWCLQGLTAETLGKFNVRVMLEENALLLLSLEVDGNITGIKIMMYIPLPPLDVIEEEDPAENTPLPSEGKVTTQTIPRYSLLKDHLSFTVLLPIIIQVADDRVMHVSLWCRVSYKGLFGLDVIQQRHTEVVLTASEFDSMAVHQATGLPAVALPNGDSTLPLKVNTTGLPPEG